MKAEISALLDDELGASAAARTLEALRREAELREAWDTYQLIGDALRRAPELSPGFSDRVMHRLAQEPVVLAPVAELLPARSPLRFALPIAASLLGVGAVAWVVLSLNAPQPAQMAAASPSPAAPAAPVGAKAAAPAASPATELPKEYLVAHQAYSASIGIQGVAPAVRTVSEIGQGARQ